MRAIFRKEMTDYFTSIRVFILFLLTLLVSGATLYSAFLGIRGTTETRFVFLKLFTTQAGGLPAELTFVNVVALFFIPIVTYAYFRGFLSGISDKRKNKSELDFNDW